MPCLTPLLLGVSLYTAHFDPSPGISNVTPGLYVQADCGPTLAVVRNSHGALSLAPGWTFTSGPYSVSLGGATGYSPYKIIPAVVPSRQFRPFGASAPFLRLSLIPTNGGAISLSLETPL